MSLLQINWLTLSIIAIVAWSLTGIIQKVALKDEQVHPAAFSAFFQTVVGILIIPIAVSKFDGLPRDFKLWGVLLISASLYVAANLLFFSALKDIEISQTTILSSTKSIWYLLFGLIFFREEITIFKLLGIALIISGIVVTFFKKGILGSFNKNHIYLIIYALIFGIAGTIDKYVLKYFEPASYTVINLLISAALTMFFVPNAVKNMKPLFKINKSNLYLILSSVTYAVVILSTNTAFNIGEISKIGPISQASIVLTVLLGIIFLKERESLVKKLVGSVIVFAGVVLLAL